jgi:hypothetical protein
MKKTMSPISIMYYCSCSGNKPSSTVCKSWSSICTLRRPFFPCNLFFCEITGHFIVNVFARCCSQQRLSKQHFLSSILFFCRYLTYTRSSARWAIFVDSSNCIENVGSRSMTSSSMYGEMLNSRFFTVGADKAMLLNWLVCFCSQYCINFRWFEKFWCRCVTVT